MKIFKSDGREEVIKVFSVNLLKPPRLLIQHVHLKVLGRHEQARTADPHHVKVVL